MDTMHERKEVVLQSKQQSQFWKTSCTQRISREGFKFLAVFPLRLEDEPCMASSSRHFPYPAALFPLLHIVCAVVLTQKGKSIATPGWMWGERCRCYYTNSGPILPSTSTCAVDTALFQGDCVEQELPL